MNIAATRTYLQGQMGCADAAQANAIIAQGLTLTTLPDFGKAGIRTACASARHPGGANAEGNPNHGELIPAIVEEKLKIATSVAKYYVSVACPMTADALNWNRIKVFQTYEEQVTNWKDALPPVEYSKEVGIVAWLENMQGPHIYPWCQWKPFRLRDPCCRGRPSCGRFENNHFIRCVLSLLSRRTHGPHLT